MFKQITLLITLIFMGVIFSNSAHSASVPPDVMQGNYLKVVNGNIPGCNIIGTYHPDMQSVIDAVVAKCVGHTWEVTGYRHTIQLPYDTAATSVSLTDYYENISNPSINGTQWYGAAAANWVTDPAVCPSTHPYVLEKDSNGYPTLCGEEGDLCGTMGILDVGGTLAEHNYASFCYRTFLGPDNNAVQCEMVSATATGTQYLSSNESCECTQGGLGEVACIYDDDPDIGAELQDYLPDTSDQVADENPTPGDEDADGSDLDDLQTANNKILQQVEDNTDEIEQKQDIGNNLLDKILDSLGAQTKLLDSINKKDSPGSIVPGTDGEEQQSDQCAPGTFLVGEDCVSFPATTYPTQDALDTTDLELQISDTEDAINQAYTTMKADLDGLFSFNLTGGTCVSNIKTFSLGGTSVDADFSICRFQEDFGIIGMVVIFLASLGAFYILIGGKNE